MPQNGLGLTPRLRYLAARARRIDVGSVMDRAKEASAQHGKWTPAVVADMLWQAGFRNVAVLRGGMAEWSRQRLPAEKETGFALQRVS